MVLLGRIDGAAGNGNPSGELKYVYSVEGLLYQFLSSMAIMKTVVYDSTKVLCLLQPVEVPAEGLKKDAGVLWERFTSLCWKHTRINTI